MSVSQDRAFSVQLHLAAQLKGKYEMLAQKLVAQEKEIQNLKATTELFSSLNHGNALEARAGVLAQLEVGLQKNSSV